MPPITLLIYSHSYGPNVGGVETIVRTLAQGLAELSDAEGESRFRVTVVTATKSDGPDSDPPFRVIRRPSFARLAWLIRTSDVVHLAGPALLPLLLATILRKPVVIEHHGYQSICPNGLLLHLPDRAVCPGHFMARKYHQCLRCESHERTMLRAIQSVLLTFPRRILSCWANQNIAITEHVRRRITLTGSTVVYHGCAIEPHSLANSSTPLQGAGRISFGYIGRLVPEKGVPVLLQAARLLTIRQLNFEVHLIGDGPERDRIEKMITSLNLADVVRLHGLLTGSALAAALEQIHVIVVPSIWEETAGLAAVEQMVRGKAIIASDIGGLGEMVADSGIRFTPGNADALAQSMLSLINAPALINELGFRAARRAKLHFSVERMISQHAQLYAHALTQQPA